MCGDYKTWNYLNLLIIKSEFVLKLLLLSANSLKPLVDWYHSLKRLLIGLSHVSNKETWLRLPLKKQQSSPLFSRQFSSTFKSWGKLMKIDEFSLFIFQYLPLYTLLLNTLHDNPWYMYVIMKSWQVATGSELLWGSPHLNAYYQ